MKQPTGVTVGNICSLQHLWELAQEAAQRPGNCGGPLKVLEMLMGRADLRPKNGGKA